MKNLSRRLARLSQSQRHLIKIANGDNDVKADDEGVNDEDVNDKADDDVNDKLNDDDDVNDKGDDDVNDKGDDDVNDKGDDGVNDKDRIFHLISLFLGHWRFQAHLLQKYIQHFLKTKNPNKNNKIFIHKKSLKK